MSASNPSFGFIGDASKPVTEQDFLLQIPKGVQSTTDLFSHYEERGDFPGYFGHNWDALLDCLRDFSWKTQRRIVIAHDDLPLSNNEKELRIYLEILETAAKDWKEVREGPFAEAAEGMPYVEHELLIIFPVTAQPTIARVLGTEKK